MDKPNVFYLTTKDGTQFCIYDLILGDDGKEVAFGYNTIDGLLDKEIYETEIKEILSDIISEEIKSHMG
jgi:hypothetical protein